MIKNHIETYPDKKNYNYNFLFQEHENAMIEAI